MCAPDAYLYLHVLEPGWLSVLRMKLGQIFVCVSGDFALGIIFLASSKQGSLTMADPSQEAMHRQRGAFPTRIGRWIHSFGILLLLIIVWSNLSKQMEASLMPEIDAKTGAPDNDNSSSTANKASGNKKTQQKTNTLVQVAWIMSFGGSVS